jgi:two-component system nitrate/nitrite response regulator NarL
MAGVRVLRVLVVGEDPLARAGLAALLQGIEGLEVVGSSVAEEADVLLWDLGLGARAEPPSPGGPPVLALLADESAAPEALAAGATGLLFRDTAPDRLAAALAAVARGLTVLDEDLAAALLRARPEPDLAEPLTPREVEVLQLLAQGLSNREIGSILGISEHTAKFHVTAILGKLGAQGRTDAVVRAARLGLLLL